MNLQLPRRKGEKPKTDRHLPHEQVSDNAPKEFQDKLWEYMLTLDSITHDSLIGPAGSRGLSTRHPIAGTGKSIVEDEFVHLHPSYDGSLHLVLDKHDQEEVIEKGWGENHPLAQNVVMVFGPRDEEELQIVKRIVLKSYQYASGDGRVSAPPDRSRTLERSPIR